MTLRTSHPLWRFAALCAAAFLLCGCSSTKSLLLKYEGDLASGSYDAAANRALDKAGEGGRDELMWRLHAGAALSFQGKSSDSIEQFDLAEDIFQKNDATPVFGQAVAGSWAMMTSDCAFPYNGTGQDRIFCCLYKALEYTSQGNQNAARTEFNRAQMHQENWLFERRKDIANAEKALQEEAARVEESRKINSAERETQVGKVYSNADFVSTIRTECQFDPNSSGDLSAIATGAYCNAYVSHLSGIIRWLQGDGGRNNLRDAAQHKPQNEIVQQDFQAVNRGDIPKDAVWIYVEDGLCPCYEERRVDIAPWIGLYVFHTGIALPILRYRGHGATVYAIEADGKSIPIPLLENIDALVKTEYDVFMRGALKREVTRAVVRTSVQITMGILANNTSNTWTKLTFRLVQIGAAIWSASTMAADIRSWTSLPKTVRMQHLARPANGQITLRADAHQLTLALPTGNSIVWVRKPAPTAPLQARIFSFE